MERAGKLASEIGAILGPQAVTLVPAPQLRGDMEVWFRGQCVWRLRSERRFPSAQAILARMAAIETP
ncbi:hypothetical protein TDMWS_13190 [Thermodesulfomicrobium sp. WS]|uniref:Rdx family protein n=1 Tax=Thermodesulfomicrobium sp. WS TaxID=3004129 RepID=UPI000ED953CD|nr:Rdx family protein [Thermodesulfomicrobium sp. WS]BDV01234.1 hypothetical protein TDMWS_13190 [Thermodesulfomicrobium sp. WS]HCF04812.1 hypothetical protein [Desulfomicrobiaceae bacterium]